MCWVIFAEKKKGPMSAFFTHRRGQRQKVLKLGVYIYFTPKNHGIFKTGDLEIQKEPCEKTHPNLSFLEGPSWFLGQKDSKKAPLVFFRHPTIWPCGGTKTLGGWTWSFLLGDGNKNDRDEEAKHYNNLDLFS